ncbi:MAG: hypothetical protein NTU62_01985 [Spirochaetes bacterium]|nr:hypothetical protein [Spirochaetota bacterium]
MKHRESFSLYLRKIKHGKVFYYRVYDKDGARTSGRSIGHTNRILARNHVIELFRNGEEVPQKELIMRSC